MPTVRAEAFAAAPSFSYVVALLVLIVRVKPDSSTRRPRVALSQS